MGYLHYTTQKSDIRAAAARHTRFKILGTRRPHTPACLCRVMGFAVVESILLTDVLKTAISQ